MASRLQDITSSEQESEYDESASEIDYDDDEFFIEPQDDQDPSSTTTEHTITGNAENTAYQTRLENILRGIVNSATQTAFEARPESAFFCQILVLYHQL